MSAVVNGQCYCFFKEKQPKHSFFTKKIYFVFSTIVFQYRVCLNFADNYSLETKRIHLRHIKKDVMFKKNLIVEKKLKKVQTLHK